MARRAIAAMYKYRARFEELSLTLTYPTQRDPNQCYSLQYPMQIEDLETVGINLENLHSFPATQAVALSACPGMRMPQVRGG